MAAAVAAAVRPATSRTSQPRAQAAPSAVPAPVVVPVGADATVLPTDTTFEALGVPAPLVEVLTASGITSPFPIQVATLPDSLSGKDVLGRGRTGSGKTLAFSLPLVARLAASTSKRQPKRPRSLILVPTRELANQVAAVVDPLARALGMKTTTIFGGVGQNPQVSALAGGLDVVIACPGRLEDLIQQGHCDLGAIEVTILDEADHMADLGFLPGVKRIMDRTPKVGQRMLFSATLDNGVDVLVKRYLTNPTTHSVDPAVAPVSHHDPPRLPRRRRRQGDDRQGARLGPRPQRAVHPHQAPGEEAGQAAHRRRRAGRRPARQPEPERPRAQPRGVHAAATTRVLCATDIAARGIHVDDVAIVVHVDPPAEHKAYLHRSGRTARAGAEGAVVTIATPDQAGEVRTLARQAGINPEVSAIKPGAREITALIGPAAPYVEPAPVAEPQPQGNGGGRRRGGGSGRGSSAAPRPPVAAAARATPASPVARPARPARRAPAPSSPPAPARRRPPRSAAARAAAPLI